MWKCDELNGKMEKRETKIYSFAYRHFQIVLGFLCSYNNRIWDKSLQGQISPPPAKGKFEVFYIIVLVKPDKDACPFLHVRSLLFATKYRSEAKKKPQKKGGSKLKIIHYLWGLV